MRGWEFFAGARKIKKHKKIKKNGKYGEILSVFCKICYNKLYRRAKEIGYAKKADFGSCFGQCA